MAITPLDLLDSGNFQTYNRQVARELGSVNAAIMLSELVNRYNYHKDKNELKNFEKYEGTWFYYQVEKCTERTVLSDKEQATALKILAPFNLFEKKSIGIPAKRHFNLDIPAIIAFITGSKNISRTAEKAELDAPKEQNSTRRKSVANKEHYKEHHEEPKKNDNEVVVVPFCLDELSISEELKQSLAKKYQDHPDRIEDACKSVAKMKPRNLEATIQAALTKGYSPGHSREEFLEKNKIWAQDSLKKYDNRKVGAYKCNILSKYIEFSLDGVATAKYFKYEDASFQGEVSDFIKKNLRE